MGCGVLRRIKQGKALRLAFIRWCMSDIFREVDEEVRRDQALKFWERYQLPIIIIAVLIVASTTGYRLYQNARLHEAEEAGARYEAAVQLVRDGKTAEADAAFAEMISKGPSGYALLARFKQANALAQNDAAVAIKLYDALAQESSVPHELQDVARLRAALVALDGADLAQATERLEPLTQTGNAFRHVAREFLALAALKQNDYDAAGRWLDALVVDTQTPQTMRQRAEVLLGLVASGAPSAQSTNTAPASTTPAATTPASK